MRLAVDWLWSWTGWRGPGIEKRLSCAVRGGVEVMFDVAGEVERQDAPIVLGAWDSDLDRVLAVRNVCGWWHVMKIDGLGDVVVPPRWC